ncbi:MAG: RagB/SusD family nutrient uptake outer membrane protein, partial [Cyclobacteriaceae bacterium]
GQNQYGRADRAALWTLQAKLYLNAEVYIGTDMYTECITACSKIIESGEYELNDVYRHNFNADNHTSEELIFAVPFDGMNTQTFGGTTYLLSASIGGNMTPANYGSSQNWGGLRTTSAIVNLFPDETGEVDSRALFFTDGQTKEINDISVFTDGYALPKYTNLTKDGIPGSNQIHPDTDFPMFRLADVYLMLAEAVLRGGEGATINEALEYVNQIRERAYGDESGNIALEDLTLDFILDERARELYWEAHRRTDLIRFNQFTENGIWPWKGNDKEGRTTSLHLNLFPIPANDIIANTKLKQNDGY